ncbi:hypothetical protein RQP46_003430 [Phenoliferia psychrophenolica]
MTDVKLALSPGRAAPLTPYLILNFVFIFVPRLFVAIPIHLIWHYLLNRRNSPLVQVIGRPWYADIPVQLVRYLFARGTAAQMRILFDRTRSYKLAHMKPEFKGKKEWLSYVKVNGTAGRWTAPPGTKRYDDEVVLYYVHGGGFVMDTGGDAQVWAIQLAKEMNIKRNVQFSVFSLDYRLAPDYKYPSQLIETLAGYHYLVNTLKISEDKICVCGDSAGGNLIAAFLLHLARPNPIISVPESLGPTPRQPGSTLLISPWVKLVTTSVSSKAHELFDYIETDSSAGAVLDYLGAPHPENKTFNPSWNPYHFFVPPSPAPHASMLPVKGAKASVAGAEGTGIELLRSPYINPSMCDEVEWLKDAFPGEGRTMVMWGGKEIFCDDVVEFAEKLASAGVNPVKVCKPLGVHDWILFDLSVPGVYITKSKGPDSKRSWGLEQLGDFLQDTAMRVRKASRAEKASTSSEVGTDADDGTPSVEGSTVLDQSVLSAGSVGDSVVIVDPNEA